MMHDIPMVPKSEAEASAMALEFSRAANASTVNAFALRAPSTMTGSQAKRVEQIAVEEEKIAAHLKHIAQLLLAVGHYMTARDRITI